MRHRSVIVAAALGALPLLALTLLDPPPYGTFDLRPMLAVVASSVTAGLVCGRPMAGSDPGIWSRHVGRTVTAYWLAQAPAMWLGGCALDTCGLSTGVAGLLSGFILAGLLGVPPLLVVLGLVRIATPHRAG